VSASGRRRNGPQHSGTQPGTLPPALDRRYLVAFDTSELPQHRTDVLVIGSGIAGIVASLEASRTHTVALVTKATISETNTWYAQGGIAGAIGEADSIELHLADTLVVGQGLCDEAVVRAVVGEAPQALADLQSLGVHFDVGEGGEVALAREGGHSLPRVLHAGDTTGAAIQDALSSLVRHSPVIEIFEERFLVDLLTVDDRCVGALISTRDEGHLQVFWADAVVLATGGSGQMYRVTTNPMIATGDGVAAAWRAGAQVADLEFVQFHPTALDSAAEPRFLITEALRGEGAYLLDCDEQRFMLGVHPLAELAPRDVVSREIEEVMRRCGRPNVWLDARHLGETLLRHRFPAIWQACMDAGFDLSKDLVPVAPAAHYQIGGVRIDIDGRTSLRGLFASGEVTESGLHGANRLASNSLLEGLVFSRRIARALEKERQKEQGEAQEREASGSGPPRIESRATAPGPGGAWDVHHLDHVRFSLQAAMSTHAGMTRSDAGLAEAEEETARFAEVLDADMTSIGGMELQNLVTVATLVVHAARARTESRGVHQRLDFAERDDENWRGHTVMRRGAQTRFEAVTG
jgi:L-aspartate oxidase